jgi:diacylglycerol kinase (ATP)
MKIKIIVNPNSNPRVVKKYLQESLRVLRRAHHRLSISFTKGPGDAFVIAQNAVKDGVDAVVTVGGDGTVNETINGIVGHGVRLGILPLGGSNVLARELRIPIHLVRAAETIVKGSTRRIDLGVINGTYFSMMASCGYDAYAVSRTSLKIKKIIRRYAYLWAGIKDFLGYRPTEIDLILDNGKVIEKGTFVVIGNTHFYGGTHQVTPFAEIDDGFLDLCIYKGKRQLGLVRFALRMLWIQHLAMKNVKYYRIRKVEMRSKKKTLVQVDGDYLGELPMTTKIVPKAIEIFC